MEAVTRAADVSRLTVYYQFDSKTGLLEALYDYIASRGNMQHLAAVFGQGGDWLRALHDFMRVFAEFWASDREVIRRLHALGAIDADIGEGLRTRNQRRRHGFSVTSFETFDALAGEDREFEEVVEIIRKLVDHTIGVKQRPVPPG